MKIILDIDEREINSIAGWAGEDFVVNEFKKDPDWFIRTASDIQVQLSPYYAARGALSLAKQG